MQSTIATAAPDHEQRPLSALTFQTATTQSSKRSNAVNNTVDEEGEHGAVSTRPQTREGATTTTSTVDNISFSEYEDLLVLAQQHFDDLRRTFKRSATAADGHRPPSKASRASKKVDNKVDPATAVEHAKSNQLLSTLLYLSLMMNKVEEVKSILKQVNAEAYDEWNVLFTMLHPPPFHTRERRMQNDRARRIFERKSHYKKQTERCETQLQRQKDTMAKLQKQANDTAQQMSTSISRLMEEISVLRQQLSSKQQVELELSRTSKEAEILRTKLLESEHEYEHARTEIQQMILSHQEALKEATSNATIMEQQKAKAEIERLIHCHQQALKEITDKAADYKNQSKFLEGQLEQQQDVLSKLQEQANDTAQQMSASISRLMEETAILRNQLLSKQQVEQELSKTNREVETLRERLGESDRGFEQAKVDMQQMGKRHQQALKEATEKTVCAYDRAANAETELRATKEALAVAQRQLDQSRTECTKALLQTRNMVNVQEKANKLEKELMAMKNLLTETHKDLNYAKDALAKALSLHAEKSKTEIKVEENLQQVGRHSIISISVCKY